MLDVGCGEGVLTHEWAERLGDGRIVGIDLDDPKLRAEWEQRSRARTSSSAPRRPPHSRSPTASSTWPRAIEVLEHVPEPEATLAEMARVARRSCSCRCPREPLWRGLNMARGAYLARPRQHARPREPLVQARVRVAAVALRHGRGGRSPFPWTMVLVRAARRPETASHPARGATAAGPRSCRWGSASPASSPSPTSRSPATRCPRTSTAQITLLWSAVFITVSVLYRPVEQLLSRTIADRDARGMPATTHLRVAATIQLGARRSCSLVWRWSCASRSRTSCSAARATLYWILIVAVLAYAASYFARGYLAGHRRFELYGGLVLMEADLALPVRARRRGRASPTARPRWRSAWPPRRSVSLVRGAVRRCVALAPARAAPPAAGADGEAAGRAAPQFTLAHGTGFAAGGAADHALRADVPERRPAAGEGHRGRRRAPRWPGFAFNVLLIARAPLQLFQAIQTSILPHLTRLARERRARPVPAQRAT